MQAPAILQRLATLPGPVRQLLLAGAWLAVGLLVLPALIFVSGIALRGRYEGAGLGPTYGSIIDGLGEGSAAAWAVVLGPYLLFLLFKALLAWWRAANWA